ncbi:hypothetical protein GCM10007350_15360 [Jeongeupia chitinilytica]|uniref:L,D-TPase catalytic domain-containing protein n=2 Tax=Jeongeupia chitinilytica TaxID=1041641 RepID=A0ABQ3H170_9NEIS|nr:hypothetical protein GCM10007350_15360 [Jeongeupia chitinilytica]
MGAVFRGRRWTGEVYSPELAKVHPERDWVLTRIIWLSGAVPGFNRFGSVDTMSRYIYIHGTPDDQPMGVPASHGCIRMRNADVDALFARLKPGIEVNIVAPEVDWCVYPVTSKRPSLGFGDTTLRGPLSPVTPDVLVGRQFALWQEQGRCGGLGGLTPGGAIWLQLSDQGVKEAERLLAVLAKEARILGWQHMDILTAKAPTPDWEQASGRVDSEIGRLYRYRLALHDASSPA